MSSSTRKEVLKVYRRALKLAKSWEAADAGKTLKERDFIKEEARTLFRKNKDVSSTGLCYTVLFFLLPCIGLGSNKT